MLNYTVPQLQFLIGGFDATEYLDSISLSVSMHEIGQALLWSGRFQLSNNVKARTNGLTDADFSEFGTPARWRPYQQLVRLNIKGYQSPALRIEDYRYNTQTKIGEGRLTQIPVAVSGDRPGVEIPTLVSGSIEAAITGLITAAFSGATITPSLALNGDSGVLDVPLSTRDPWADAVRLSGLSWHWLTVDGTESIASIPGDGDLIFTRTQEQIELVPDLAAIYQSANKVIVTGARQVDDDSPDNVGTPRPKTKTTSELRALGDIFPGSGFEALPTLFEEKTITYQYWDDPSLPEFGSALSGFLSDFQDPAQSGINPYSPPKNLTTPLQTLTVKRQPLGYIFPDFGVETLLTIAEVICESKLRKMVLKPIGLVLPDAGTETDLMIASFETLTSEPVEADQLVVPAVDANGESQTYEPRPILEPQQPAPTRPLKTEVLKGVGTLTQINWTPVYQRPLVVDLGFLPDQARAEFLAQKIAIREQRRRDQVLVDMPIPTEWLANGWPLLSRCQLGNNVYLMDGCAISISDGEAKFGFTGALISREGTASYQILLDLMATITMEVDLLSAPAVDTGTELIVELILGTGTKIDVIADWTTEWLVASSPGLPIEPIVIAEAAVQAVLMLVVPVDSSVLTEAIVSIGILQTLNISVSPSSQLEGTPAIQTLNISVSPSSQLEGS